MLTTLRSASNTVLVVPEASINAFLPMVILASEFASRTSLPGSGSSLATRLMAAPSFTHAPVPLTSVIFAPLARRTLFSCRSMLLPAT